MLRRVTLTGADDTVSPHELAALSARYPFVEWGILVSRCPPEHGRHRFPSLPWLEPVQQERDRQRELWVRRDPMITGDLTTEGIAGACRAAGVRSRQ